MLLAQFLEDLCKELGSACLMIGISLADAFQSFPVILLSPFKRVG